MIILLLTLMTSIVNASGGRTNILEGVVELLLFASYIVLIFD